MFSITLIATSEKAFSTLCPVLALVSIKAIPNSLAKLSPSS
jgi:hypothetical protein